MPRVVACGVGLAAALVWGVWSLLAGALAPAADLRPVMPEVDGVHPLRAVAAWHTAYDPGEGFLDKYPPLGSFLMGAVVHAADATLSEPARTVVDQQEGARRLVLWQWRDAIAEAVDLQRGMSLIAMACAVALSALLAAEVLARRGLPLVLAATLGVLVPVAGFGQSYVVQFYATTTNVDAASLAAVLAAAWCVLRGSAPGAGVALGLAVAFKDPAFALGPAVVLAAWADRGRGYAGRVLVWSLGTYLLAGGAVLTPSTWWTHVAYLVTGGVDSVPRIDHRSVSEVAGLLGYAVRLSVEAVGLGAIVLAGAGLLLAWRDRAVALLLGLGVLGPLALFVLPAGFVYPRFLLASTGLLAAGTSLALGVAAWGLVRWFGPGAVAARWGRGAVALGLLLGAAVLLGGLAERWRLPAGAEVARDELARLRAGEDPRRAATAAVEQQVGGDALLVLFSSQAGHGPPLDPTTTRYEVRGLAEVEPSMSAWLAMSLDERPEYLLFMDFPTEPPSGRPLPPAATLAPGELVAGSYVVQSVHGRPEGGIVERTLATRPVLTLLRRIDG